MSRLPSAVAVRNTANNAPVASTNAFIPQQPHAPVASAIARCSAAKFFPSSRDTATNTARFTSPLTVAEPGACHSTYTLPAPSAAPSENEMRSRQLLVDALSDKNPDTRKAAVVALGLVGAREPYVSLVESMLTDKDIYVRLAAVATMADLRGPRTVGALQKALYDESPEVTYAAAKQLWAMNDPEGRKAMMAVLSGEAKTSSGFLTLQTRDRFDVVVQHVGTGLDQNLERFRSLHVGDQRLDACERRTQFVRYIAQQRFLRRHERLDALRHGIEISSDCADLVSAPIERTTHARFQGASRARSCGLLQPREG